MDKNNIIKQCESCLSDKSQESWSKE